MLVQKIRENAGKVSVFFLALISAVGGVFYLKAQSLEKKLLEAQKMRPDELEAIKNEAIKAATTQINSQVATDSKEKLDSIANNPKETTVQEPVTTKTTIPAQTKTVTSPTTSKTSTTSKSSKTTKSS